MKIRFLLALAALVISFAVSAFAQQKDTVDPQVAEQIRALATKFDEAFNKNDAVAVAAFLTDNALLDDAARNIVRSGGHRNGLC